MICSATTGRAEEEAPKDSVRIYRLQEIEVTATRATPKSPVAYTDLTRSDIAANNYGRDIPFLLMLTPSVIATSETGVGIGATSMRMRGTDATRLNVTANGVPLNNPDSHAMYWYDTPDLISSVGSVQVQRGAGVSTNGTGAFGGAVNMTTAALSTEFEGDASLSYGSYSTNKQAVHIGSGLMGGHWVVDARLSHIGSDGYIDRGATDLKSYMFQGAYYNGNSMLKLTSFGGKAVTNLTYNGATKDEMKNNGRRYNSSGMYKTSDAYSHRIWNSEAGEWQQVNYYYDQTDNYLQFNNQLLFNHRFNDRWEMNATGFYTYGYGYYKQYKDDAKLIENGFSPADALTPDGSKIKKDLIREKLMRNHFGGVNASVHYTAERVDFAFGGSWSYYTCPHWGEQKWVQDSPQGFTKGMRWYDNDATKQDANLFARLNIELAKGLNVSADMQYRRVHYKAAGVNDNYDYSTEAMQTFDVDETYDFLNPRVGATWNFARNHTLFASFAIAQKEPTRDDFTDRFREVYPRAEKLFDYEIGYQFASRYASAGVNLYYMVYHDQLVQTGQINDSGDALNTNVPDSYRRGVELTAAVRPSGWLTISANATFSQNRIENYTNRVTTDWAGNYKDTYMGTTRISYAPEIMGTFIVDFHYKGFEAVFHTQSVGEQYFVNYSNPNMRLDAYSVSNLALAYTMHTKAARSVRFGVTVYNLFNREYCSNGYGYSAVYGEEQYDLAYYFPQAPINVLANVTVKF